MKKIYMLQIWRHYDAGIEYEFDDDRADWLIAEGFAREIKLKDYRSTPEKHSRKKREKAIR